MTTLTSLIALAAPFFQGVTAEQGDLQVTTFTLPQGTINVYLPDDMAPGDTISGTVIATPSGSGQLRIDNEAVLTGYVVEVRGTKGDPDQPVITGHIPNTASVLDLVLRSPNGSERGAASVPIFLPDIADNPTVVSCDPILMSGAPIRIPGPFDGNTQNTAARVGESVLVPLAESPRSCVFAGTPQVTGPVKIQVSENGRTTQLDSNMLKITLTAGKTMLARGEKTELKITVSGLEGLGDDAFPIPIEVRNLTPQIVHIEETTESGNVRGETFATSIPKPDVRPYMPMTFTLGLTGVQPGQFLIKGVCFNVRMHDVKKQMNAKTFNAWVSSLIAIYKEKIKRLEAEPNANTDPGLKANIARKKGILEVLNTYKGSRDELLSIAKISVDKALADDAFFSMAADLITTAAEFLGYTDIPMPGVRQIVGGIKAIAGAAKLEKVLEALKDVEKLMDAYDKINDANAKAEQAKKIKDALDKVKEAMDNSE